MTTNGALLRDDDGAIYFVPRDVLESYRLEGESLEAARQALGDEPEVEGFVDPGMVRIWTPFYIGSAIGGQVGNAGDEPAAAVHKTQAGMSDLSTESASTFQPRRRRF